MTILQVYDNATYVTDLDLLLQPKRSIAITNSSFDVDGLDDGKWVAGAFGWTTNKNGYTGAWDPEASDFTGSPHGQNVAWIEGEGTSLRQTLSETYDNTASYKFSLSAGDSVHYGTQNFTINLYAGDVLIGTMTGSTSGDGFVTTTLLIDQTERADLNGQSLTFEIVNNSSGELFVDNVQAEVIGGAGGDATVYTIVGGADADLFVIDNTNGELTFKSPPDYGNPNDQGGDNVYDVVVRATFADGTVSEEAAQVQVRDNDAAPVAIEVAENTSFVADLEGGLGVPDLGTSICLKDKDLPEDNKPVELVLTYSFGTEINQVDQQKSDKAFLENRDSDGDGTVFIQIWDKDFHNVLFAGTVSEGQSFAITNGGSKFDSETNFEVFSEEGGPLIQSGQFHTSTSQPLAIGDVFGSIAVNGATLGAGDSFGMSATDGSLGDLGVLYKITGGADAALFDVDPKTGEVSFLTPPDYETPQSASGSNVYDLSVSTYEAGNPAVLVDTQSLRISVTDDLTDAPIDVDENTTIVVDLNLSVDCFQTVTGNDFGQDLCVLKDKDLPEHNKPVSLTLTYTFGTTIDQLAAQDPDKAFLTSFGTDVDGTVFIRILDKDFGVLFEGAVSEGESFSVTNGGSKFDSETNFEIYDIEGGALIQSGQFHTSCSQPLAIGDTFGSLTMNGATLGGGQVLTGTATVLDVLSEGEIEYSIAGGADAALFHVDTTTGVVSFINPQSFEDPQDQNGDNVYDLVVRATAKTDAACHVDEVLQVRISDIDEQTGNAITGRVFAETSFNEGFGDTDYGVGHATVVLLKDGLRLSEVRTNADGSYRFDGLEQGDYMVKILPLSGGRLVTNSANVSVVDGSSQTVEFEVYFHDYTTQLNTFDAASFTADFDTLLRYGGDAEGSGSVTYSLLGEDASLFAIDAQTGQVNFRPEVLSAGSAPVDTSGDGIYNFTVLRDGGAFLSVPREEVELKLLGAGDTESGMISGQYFDDVRGTGLKVGGNGDAPGVKNAMVVLLDDQGNFVYDNFGQLISTITDAHGAYVLRGVPQGNFKVGFEAFNGKSFGRKGKDNDGNGRADVREASDVDDANLTQPVSVPNSNGQGTRLVEFGATGSINVAAGEVVADIDASVISGAVYGTEASDVLTGSDGTDRMFGFAGDDILNGGAGNDVLDGGAGFDVLTGGSGQDAFIFRESEGTTTITDFQIGYDFLDIEGFDGIEDDEGLRSMATQQGSDTVFDLDGWTLILQNVDLATLGPGDLCAY